MRAARRVDAASYVSILALRIVADCGHLVIVERPAACLDAPALLG
jgi:hypothetical protein